MPSSEALLNPGITSRSLTLQVNPLQSEPPVKPNEAIFRRGFPGTSAGKESACNAGNSSLIPRLGRSAGEGKDRLPTPVFLGFPGGSAGKESACNVGDLGLIPGLGRSPGEENSYPLQYSGLENSMGYPWGRKELDTTD